MSQTREGAITKGVLVDITRMSMWAPDYKVGYTIRITDRTGINEVGNVYQVSKRRWTSFWRRPNALVELKHFSHSRAMAVERLVEIWENRQYGH